MNMDIFGFMEILLHAEALCTCTDKRESCFCTLFHNISKLTRKFKAAVSFHDRYFNRHCNTAYCRPCKTNTYSDRRRFREFGIRKLFGAEILSHIFRHNIYMLVIFYIFTCAFSCDRSYLALKRSYTALRGIT